MDFSKVYCWCECARASKRGAGGALDTPDFEIGYFPNNFFVEIFFFLVFELGNFTTVVTPGKIRYWTPEKNPSNAICTVHQFRGNTIFISLFLTLQ